MGQKYVSLSDWIQIKISGPDTINYLNGIITKDLYQIQDNEFSRSAFLTPNAHIRSVYWVWKRDDAVFLFCPPMMKQALIEDLLKYKLSMDVKLEDISEETPPLYLIEGQEKIPGLSFGDTSFVFVNKDDPPNGTEMSYLEFQNLLVENGVLPVEYMVDHNPFEVGISDAISLEKGCFLGQEPISRMYHRGNPRKYVYQIEGHSLTKGDDIFQYDNQVGAILAVSDKIGLTFIRRNVDPLDNLHTKNGEIKVLGRIGSYPHNNR